MIRRRLGFAPVFVFCLLAFVSTMTGQDSRARLELVDGDRVILLGGTFIEREGQFGYLETALTT